MSIDDFVRNMNAYMATREKLDINAVYLQLKDTCNLTLTHAFARKNGKYEYDEDYPMLCGASSAGEFQLYDNGLDIVFDVDMANGEYTHWHPQNTAEAVADVIAFMQGICKE